MSEPKKICAHVGTRGNNKDIKCRNAAKIGNFCAKHKKKERPTLATDEVFGNGEAAPAAAPAEAPKPKKFHYSAFKFTINSQMDFAKMSPAEKKQFKHAVEFIFDKDNVHKYLEDRTNAGDTRANISELKVEFFFEVGAQQGRLHTHGVLSLKHTGNYRVNQERVRAVLEKLLGRKVHLNVVGSADETAAWAAYITKNQAAAQKVEL